MLLRVLLWLMLIHLMVWIILWPYYGRLRFSHETKAVNELWMNSYAGTHWDYSTETTHTTVNWLLSVHKSTLSPLSSLLSSFHTIIVVIITTNVIIHMVVSPQGWLLFAIEELFGRLTAGENHHHCRHQLNKCHHRTFFKGTCYLAQRRTYGMTRFVKCVKIA